MVAVGKFSLGEGCRCLVDGLGDALGRRRGGSLGLALGLAGG